MRAPRDSVVTEVTQRVDNNAYMRLYRQRRPEVVRRNTLKGLARNAAALAVAKRYPDEFAAAVKREERKRGLR